MMVWPKFHRNASRCIEPLRKRNWTFLMTSYGCGQCGISFSYCILFGWKSFYSNWYETWPTVNLVHIDFMSDKQTNFMFDTHILYVRQKHTLYVRQTHTDCLSDRHTYILCQAGTHRLYIRQTHTDFYVRHTHIHIVCQTDTHTFLCQTHIVC